MGTQSGIIADPIGPARCVHKSYAAGEVRLFISQTDHLRFRFVAHLYPGHFEHFWIEGAGLNLLQSYRIHARESLHHFQQGNGCEARVLATSREPLRIPGERVFPLDPLS